MATLSWRIAPEIAEALLEGRGVVALESTIIAHGLPYPDNLEVGRALEAAVRAQGAVPATIAIIDGVPTVGLDEDALERIAHDGPAKTSAVDMAYYMATGRCAATTVSATALVAARVGIRVFATGGIGGVHRGDAGDVSHDLFALSRCPMAVVSAGAKAILDLPRTLEMLESLGVLVIGYRTDRMPAFYSRDAGLPLVHRADQPEELARVLRARFDAHGLEQPQGVLVANPIPEAYELPRADMEVVIEDALREAERLGVFGKRLTPFLLAHIAELTQGRSVAANRALAVANAELAGQIASAYASAYAGLGREPSE